MTEDMLNVVDAGDRVVGIASRREVHARGLLHRAVHILISNAAGDVLLQRRSMRKDSHPGKWDSSASGHVDAGEGYLDAAVRELREELGLSVDPADLIEAGRISAGRETDQEFVTVYRCVGEGPFVPNAEEITEVRFASPDWIAVSSEREPSSFAPSFLEVWKRYGSGGVGRA